jgi:hypothetical protein
VHILSLDEIKKPAVLVEIESGETEEDWEASQELLGGVTERVILKEDGQWVDFITEYESQKNDFFNAFDCATQGGWNGVQIVINYLYGIVLNKSKRYTAVMGGTVPGKGASMNQIMEAIRKIGSVEEELWPSMTPEMTEDEFYKPIPGEVQEKESFLKSGYLFNHEWVKRPLPFNSPASPEDIWSMLKYSPIPAAVDGNYVFYEDKLSYEYFNRYTHVILIVGGIENEYFLILDSENPSGLIKADWNYKFGYCKSLTVHKTFDLIKLESEPDIYQVSGDTKKYVTEEEWNSMGNKQPEIVSRETLNKFI